MGPLVDGSDRADNFPDGGGTAKVSAVFGLQVIAYNLIRLGNLLRPPMAAA